MPINKASLPNIASYILCKIIKSLTPLRSAPYHGYELIDLEISRNCNLNCVMCLRKLLKDKKGHMELEIASKISRNVEKVLGIGIAGWGEPTLHPYLTDILNIFSRRGHILSITTNGARLEEYVDDLLKIRTLHHITLSMDLPITFEDYAHSQIAHLETLKLIEMEKRRRGLKFPTIIVSTTVMKSNVEFLPKMVDLLAKYGLDRLDIHRVVIFKKEFLNTIFAPPDDDIFNKYLSAATLLGSKYGVRVTSDFLVKHGYDLSKKIKFSNPPCEIPWEAPYIDYKGYVHPCCYYQFKKLGNAAEEKLISIWKEKQYVKFRARLLNGLEDFCNNCLKGRMYLNFSPNSNAFLH